MKGEIPKIHRELTVFYKAMIIPMGRENFIAQGLAEIPVLVLVL
jgi:hypothetical protein